ncbi:MAG: undecaprenyl/decaprenyl-phosphate alpha-N-acetylglucosaminyl 1-phosphate transferase [Acidobacteriota bacterium]|nr:undecaprenyl/decaprenyl-phosphate alpha-N-acetylglucosaminyl 1-phosphate transferase [Acidobacteriota bacterium]
MQELSPLLLLIAVCAGAVAAAVTSLVIPGTVHLALRLGALDYPGGRKQHRQATPRLGGLAIALGVAAAAGGAIWLQWNGVGREPAGIVAIVVGTGLVFAVGVIDDVRTVSAISKLCVQMLAAFIVASNGIRFEVLGLPMIGEFELGAFSVIASVLWIVGVTNAINLIDGLDGLAGGITAIVAASFSIYAIVQGNPLSVIVSAALVGSCIGFLLDNWHPARVHMGDSGSLTLGFLLATVSVHSSLKASAAVAILVPVLALGLPVIDVLLVMARRFSHEPDINPIRRLLQVLKADRNHVHHLLQLFGATRGRILWTLYGLVLTFCLFSLVTAVTKSAQIGVALAAVELAALVIVRRWGLPGHNGARSTQASPVLPEQKRSSAACALSEETV